MPRGVYERTRSAMRDRFWAKVDRRGQDECWVWTAGRSEGYGRFMTISIGGVADTVGAHVFSHWLATGVWPSQGMDVRHSCHNRACVNPAHLSLGTRLDNMRDMKEAGRQRRGEDKPNHKLTWLAAASIREAHAQGAEAVELARRYGVSAAAIRQVINHRTWSTAS